MNFTITVGECNSRFDLLAGLPDGEPPPGPLDWPPVPPQQHHAGLDHAQTVLCNRQWSVKHLQVGLLSGLSLLYFS